MRRHISRRLRPISEPFGDGVFWLFFRKKAGKLRPQMVSLIKINKILRQGYSGEN